jgi:hypothetical protein
LRKKCVKPTRAGIIQVAQALRHRAGCEKISKSSAKMF